MNRVWTFVMSKPLGFDALAELQAAGSHFVATWSAHENQLAANFSIYENRILVFKVNEEVHGASGCSIDKLTRFIKEAELRFGIELLNRLLVAYRQGNSVDVIHASNIKNMLAQGLITEDTTVYNTAVANENELALWEQPLKHTWLNKYLVSSL